ncbi:hypothetical protein C8Q80DRAFT_602436 [Daedaleopsis nitida]|nr:hypothetical protein C8Q80DRAFT_602436 [Daedaleopsis nitida]
MPGGLLCLPLSPPTLSFRHRPDRHVERESHHRAATVAWKSGVRSVLRRLFKKYRTSRRDGSPVLLPPELWMAIFDFADPRTLTQLMRVNRVFQRFAVPALYHAPRPFTSGDGLARFARSVTTRPHHADLIQSLDMRALNIHDYAVATNVLFILKSCPNLRELRLNVFPHCQICITAEWSVYEELGELSFPLLRRFAINLYNSPVRLGLVGFFDRHPNLEELNFGGVPYPRPNAPLDPLSKVRLPSLRRMTVPSWVLLSGLGTPPNLTHIYLSTYSWSKLPNLLSVLGSEIVSLKLGDRDWEDDVSALGSEDGSTISFGKLLVMFPSLRFLQVNMIQTIPTRTVSQFSGTLPAAAVPSGPSPG